MSTFGYREVAKKRTTKQILCAHCFLSNKIQLNQRYFDKTFLTLLNALFVFILFVLEIKENISRSRVISTQVISDDIQLPCFRFSIAHVPPLLRDVQFTKYRPARNFQKCSYIRLVLQRKPFAFALFFCLANEGFFTFSSKTHSVVPTSNLCRNVQRPKNQFNQQFLATCISYLERTDKNKSTYTTNQR